MKKLLYVIPALLLALTSCDGFFELDNMEGPNAQITGKFVEADGTPVFMESYDIEETYSWGQWTLTVSGPQAGYIQAYELGWDSEAAQTWYVKYDGTYTNNRVFAGKYRLDFSKLPVFPIEGSNEIVIEKGGNTKDFTVVPYARVKNVDIKFEGGKFVATFRAEGGKSNKAITKMKFLVNTDKYVSTSTNKAKDASALAECPSEWDWATWSMKVSPFADGTYTLSIDPNLLENEPEFGYQRAHYFRVGVLSQIDGYNNDGLYNYSEIFKVTPTFDGNGKITGIASVDKVTF